MSKKVVIGIAGKLASGKGTITKYIVDTYQAEKTRSSDPLRATLDIFDVPQSRENLDMLSTFVRSIYGENTIARAVARVLRESKAGVVLFDGMRRLVDVEAIRAFEHSLFIYVHADQKIRYERCKSRNENVGDDTMSFEEFAEKDDDEPQQQIEALREYADVVIDNSGDLDTLMKQIHDQIDIVISKLLAPTT